MAPDAAPPDRWERLRSYNCFGCSSRNASGLQLRWHEIARGIDADFVADDRFESYPGIVHGGIVATALDEVMGNAVIAVKNVVSVTTTLRIRYVSAVHVGRRYRVRATLASEAASTYRVRGEIVGEDGQLAAVGDGVYQAISVDMARRIFTDASALDRARPFLSRSRN